MTISELEDAKDQPSRTQADTEALDVWMTNTAPRDLAESWLAVQRVQGGHGQHQKWLEVIQALIRHWRAYTEGAYHQQRVAEGPDETRERSREEEALECALMTCTQCLIAFIFD